MDKCITGSGPPQSCSIAAGLTLLEDEEMNKCAQREVVPENTHGCKCFLCYFPSRVLKKASSDLDALPGCNPIQPGPAQATPITNCNAVSTTIGLPTQATAIGIQDKR